MDCLPEDLIDRGQPTRLALIRRSHYYFQTARVEGERHWSPALAGAVNESYASVAHAGRRHGRLESVNVEVATATRAGFGPEIACFSGHKEMPDHIAVS